MNARCPTCNAELGDDSRCVACTLRLGVNADSNALASGFEAKPSDVPSPKQGLKGGEGPGDTLGVYRLIEVLGEGGMGHVWLAEQSTPLRRKVALKVIKPGLDSTQVLARFDAERQALALMDHPNIARVLDAGSTRNGRPYFVMEWVQGEPLTRFCDTRRLPIADRLRLVMAVCAAIQHAHQKGVIHRDIKPGNVLVTSLDGRSVPKVIDFGVAKAINQRLAERTLFTQLGAIVGTPEYMSPEQAELNDTDVDTRSDIYSLGVLLYEVLTGVVPLGPGASRRLPFDELLRQVREVDPPRPSAAVTQSGLDPAEVAARRGLESRTLAAALRGDLDWIVMRALEKDRSRRYPTANGLLLDLERYLAHEPVSARPPSGLYQLNKLVRRHRLAFAAAATTCLTLMIGLAVSAWSLHLERQARRRADRAESEQSSLRAAAEKAATRSREVADFLTRMLQGVGPAVAVGRDTALLREILDETSRSLREDLKAQPEVEADLSTTLSRVLTDLAEYPKAVEMARRAVALRPQATSIDGTASADRAASLRALARALAGAGELPESEATAREALDLLRRLGPESLPAVAESLAELGRILLLRDRPRSAETTFREAGALWERLGLPDDPRAADALHGLAQSIHAQGIERYADSLPVYQEALQATRRALGKHPQVADQLADYGMLLANQWKLSEGEVPIREALALRIELLGPTHPRVADTLYLLCDTL
ncbi:MAG: protein kinase, partial [Limisphaerales bacterium]